MAIKPYRGVEDAERFDFLSTFVLDDNDLGGVRRVLVRHPVAPGRQRRREERRIATLAAALGAAGERRYPVSTVRLIKEGLDDKS